MLTLMLVVASVFLSCVQGPEEPAVVLPKVPPVWHYVPGGSIRWIETFVGMVELQDGRIVHCVIAREFDAGVAMQCFESVSKIEDE